MITDHGDSLKIKHPAVRQDASQFESCTLTLTSPATKSYYVLILWKEGEVECVGVDVVVSGYGLIAAAVGY